LLVEYVSRGRKHSARLTWYLPRTVEVSSESKSVHTLFVIGAEVVDGTIVPAVFCPDFIDESRGNIVDVDFTLSYKTSELFVVSFIPPLCFFLRTKHSRHLVCRVIYEEMDRVRLYRSTVAQMPCD
jgi:hypothetical protein